MSEDPINFEGGIDFYAYTLNNPVNWIDPFGLEVQECRRPLHVVGSSQLPPHTFVYSTQTRTGSGLGPAPGFDVSSLFGPVPGSIEKDYPYDQKGELKPGYSCRKVSDNQCYESCVNRKVLEATKNPAWYSLGSYQCDTWANDIERQCKQECHQ